MAESDEPTKEKAQSIRNNAPWGSCPFKQPVPIQTGQSPLAIPLKGTTTPNSQTVTLITPPCQGPSCQWFNKAGNHCIIWDIAMALTVSADTAAKDSFTPPADGEATNG